MPVVISGNSGVSIGGSIVGGSVTVSGKRITSSDGVIIIGGSIEDLPKVHEEYDGVKSISLDDCSDVSFQTGNKFSAEGTGHCKKSGSHVSLSQFSGSITSPDVDGLEVVINSGSVRGQISSASVDAKVNSGSLNLKVLSRDKSPRINAKVNSGNVNITVM